MNDYEIAVMRGQQKEWQALTEIHAWRERRRVAAIQLGADLRAAARIRVDWIFWGWFIGLFGLAMILHFLVL